MLHRFNIPLILFLVLLIFGLIPQTRAQETTGGFSGSFSRMGFSPRGMAMGNAMTSVYQEGSYSYYNPAFTAMQSNQIQVDGGVALLPFDRQLNILHSHFQLPPSAGFSASILHSSVGNIDGRDINGYHTETLSTHEFQFSGAFGLRFSESFWAGIGLKYNVARFHADLPTTSGLGIDLGILFRPTSKVNIGFTVQDLLASYRLNTTDLYGSESANRQEYFPVRIVGGASYEFTQRWLISIDIEHRMQTFEEISEPDPSAPSNNRVENTSASQFLRSGANYRAHERITLRAGIQVKYLGDRNDIQPTAGFSIHLPYDKLSPSIDYAFLREPSGFTTMHVFAIRLHI